MNQDKLTPQQALQVLDQATAQLAVPREAHIKIQEALQVLMAAVQQPEGDTKKGKNTK
jgi:hypothetical protein